MNEKETLSARSLGAEVRIDVSLPRRKYRVVGGCLIAQIFEGPFSAVSQPILAIRGSFRLFYHLEYVHIVFQLEFQLLHRSKHNIWSFLSPSRKCSITFSDSRKRSVNLPKSSFFMARVHASQSEKGHIWKMKTPVYYGERQSFTAFSSFSAYNGGFLTVWKSIFEAPLRLQIVYGVRPT